MKQKLKNIALALIASLLLATPLIAAEKGDVVVDLKGFKVVTGADKKESILSVDKAKPGDIIEYRATYTNKGKNAAANLKATLPIPTGTEYLGNSARPATVLASLDGKTFSPAPLKRKVTLPSGKTELENVPSSEYRALRWELAELKAGQSSVFSMRVKISTEPPQAPAK